jgi:hypothetical protein
MPSHDWLLRARKLGSGLSLFFAAVALYGLIRLVAIDEMPIFSGQRSDFLFFLAILILGLMMIYQDRELWKAWAAAFASPGIIMLAGALSLSGWGIGVVIRIVSLSLAIFAFLNFWKHKRNVQG